MAARISAIVIARNEGRRLRETVENLADTLPGEAEIVVVDDASAEPVRAMGRRARLLRNRAAVGVARARNQGAAVASGEVLIFCDGHIGMEADWWLPLMAGLDERGVAAVSPAVVGMRKGSRVGYGLTIRRPHLEADWLLRRPARAVAAPILPGACLAMRRETFSAVNGFDEGMRAAGNVDNEMCIRLWTFGYELRVTPEATVRHHFRARAPYSLPGTVSLHNRLRLAMTHFSPERIERVTQTLLGYRGCGEALLMLAEAETASRRAWIEARRKRSDDWFFKKFRLHW